MEAISISPVSLFLEAGPVGRGVMIVLLAASVWCWVLIVTISLQVMRLNRAIRAAARGEMSGLTGAIYREGRTAAEIAIAGETVAEMRARLQEAMNRAGRALVHRAEGGLPNLAVISSVAPFIGLFGTVWGIMTSFTGIAAARDTSLAVVAPGIAEALAATAYGLAAAIPASIAYSRLGAALGSAAGDLGDLVEIESVRLMVATAPVPVGEEIR